MVRQRRARRGSLYLSVAGAAMLVSIAGLAAMHVARIELRAAAGDQSAIAARLAADAGVALALHEIADRTNWRTFYESGRPTPTGAVELGGAEFQFVLDAGVGPTGEPIPLDDAAAVFVTVRGVGRAGGAVAVTEVTIGSDADGLDSLDASVAARNDIVLGDGGFLSMGDDLRVDHPVFAGGSISSQDSDSEVEGDASAVGSISAGVTGTALGGQPARAFPNPSTVFEYYKQRGAWIDIDDLPQVGGAHVFRDDALGPGRNPFGSATNAEGIYVIDCRGREVVVRDARVFGTLVLLDNNSNSRIEGQVNWSPAATGYPALMTENGLTLGFDSLIRLRELGGVNLNPPGAPYEGASDTSPDGSYPSEINGLIYVGGKLIADGALFSRVNGSLMCDELEVQHDVRVNFRRDPLLSPPPGFAAAGEMAVTIGSWRRGQN